MVVAVGAASVLLSSAKPPESTGYLAPAASSQPATPAELARRIVRQPDLSSELTGKDHNTFVATYSLKGAGTVGAAKRLFNHNAKELVPALFAQFDHLDRVTIFGQDELVDARGNSDTYTVMMLSFTRESAATINWQNVLPENLPQIADAALIEKPYQGQ